MVLLNTVLKSAADVGAPLWHASRILLLALIAACIGLWIGFASTGSSDTAALICSVLAIILFVLLVLHEPFDGFLAWLFFTPLIDTWVKVPMGAGLPDLSFGRFGLVFLAVAMLLRISVHRFRLKPFSWSDVLVVAIPLGMLVSVPLAVEPTRAAERTLALHIMPLAAYFYARQFIQDKGQLNRLLWVIAIFGMVAGAHALYEATTGNILIKAQDQEIKGLLRGSTNMRLIIGLIGGTGAMARVLSVTLLVTIYLFLIQNRLGRKRILALGALVEFGGLFVTFSRTPLIACMLGLLILQFCFPALRKILLVLAVVVAIGLGVAWDQFQQTEVAQDRVAMGSQDLGDRQNRWQVGYRMWLAKPIRGWGQGHFDEVSGKFRTDGYTRNVNAVENDYLYILVNAGLLGFAPYALFLLHTLLRSVQLFFHQRGPRPPGFVRPYMIALVWAVMASFLVTSLTAMNAHAIMKVLPFVIAGAIVGSQEYLLREPKPAMAAHRTRFAPSSALGQH